MPATGMQSVPVNHQSETAHKQAIPMIIDMNRRSPTEQASKTTSAYKVQGVRARVPVHTRDERGDTGAEPAAPARGDEYAPRSPPGSAA